MQKMLFVASCALWFLVALLDCDAASAAEIPQSVTILVTGSRTNERGITAIHLVKMMGKYAPNTQFNIEFAGEKPAGTSIRKTVESAPKDGSILTIATSLDVVYKGINNQVEEPYWELIRLVDVFIMQPLICLTYPDSPYANVKTFIKVLRENPEKIRHPIFGKYNAFFASYFTKQIGVKYADLTHVIVPKGGSTPEFVVEKKADFVCNTAGFAVSWIESGKLIPIFSNSIRPILPQYKIPTAREIGLKNLEKYTYWVALAAPRGTNTEVMSKLRKILKKVSDDPEWKSFSEMQYGISPIGKINDLDDFVREQVDFYEKIYLGSSFFTK